MVESVVEIQLPGQNTIVLSAPWESLYYTELLYVTTLLSILLHYSALSSVMCFIGKPHLRFLFFIFCDFSLNFHYFLSKGCKEVAEALNGNQAKLISFLDTKPVIFGVTTFDF